MTFFQDAVEVLLVVAAGGMLWAALARWRRGHLDVPTCTACGRPVSRAYERCTHCGTAT